VLFAAPRREEKKPHANKKTNAQAMRRLFAGGEGADRCVCALPVQSEFSSTL